MKKTRGSYSKEKIKRRKAKQEERQNHIQGLQDGTVTEELPEPIFPEIFKDIQDTYWESLKSVPDPRSPINSVYPLPLILHRIIAGFLSGNKFIGVLFPIKRKKVEDGKRKLGGLPTRKAVYDLLKRIDWVEANVILAPLWERLGYTPDLVVRRVFRNPKIIMDEFKEERKAAEEDQRKQNLENQKKEERSKGMSAAKAKRSGVRSKKGVTSKDKEIKAKTKEENEGKKVSAPKPVKILHNLVVDGKVVKASYNSGVTERFVHVTEVKTDENDNRSRFIIGAQPTVLDRKGEWGAALSILDSLTPLPTDRVILISGDAGICVNDFCDWLTQKGFFLPLPNEGERR